MHAARPLTVWLLDEGTPGHTVQTMGLGQLLADQVGARCHRVECRLSLRGFLRPWARAAVGVAQGGIAARLIRQLYGNVVLPTTPPPDLILSSCGNSAYLNRLLARVTGARNVFIGETAPFPERWFDLVVSPVGAPSPRLLLCPLMETGRTPEAAALAAQKHWSMSPAPTRCWTMLIGGRSRSHPFTQADWTNLATGMNRLSREHGFRWLVTTSRRTGAETEHLLKSRLDPACIAEATWWAENPRKVMGAYLHAGERIFATQDSLTMMSEAIAVKGHVNLVQPARLHFERGSFGLAYLERLEADSRVSRFPASLDGFQLNTPSPTPLAEAQEQFARRFVAWCQQRAT